MADDQLETLRQENQKLKLQLIKMKSEADSNTATFKDLIQKLYKELQESSKAHQDFKAKVMSEQKEMESLESDLKRQKDINTAEATKAEQRIEKLRKLEEEMETMLQNLVQQQQEMDDEHKKLKKKKKKLDEERKKWEASHK